MKTNYPLKLWVYTFCYNEEKILPYIIEYWKQYATKVIVYNNGSTDNSLKILSQYSWIEIREFDTENTFDPEKISQYKSFCYADAIGKADYVMVCDIDEVLFPIENLFPELILAKKDNAQLFQTKYYEIINNELNPKYDSLIHTAEGYYAYPNPNIHKAIIFDPLIKISFGPNSLSYTTDIDYKTNSIITLHLKLFNASIFAERQKHLISRLKTSYKFSNDSLYYGSDKNIGTRMSYFKLLFPYKYRFNKNENYITITDNIYTANNQNIQFKDMAWLPTQINHNSENANKECIFGIPVYKSALSVTEKASLNQLCKIIGNEYELCLICPADMALNEYIEIANKHNIKLSTLFCAKQYFRGTKTYSFMCETADFYKCFDEYKYLFIYQLDGWIFENKVKEYLDLNIDYIGSPWDINTFHFQTETVGNGGVSLRRVEKFINVCNSLTASDYLRDYVDREDLFFCKTMVVKSALKKPSVKQACGFSISGTGLQGYFIHKYNNGKLPMCLHAWHKDLKYWTKYIDLSEFNETVKEPVKIPVQQKNDYKTRLELIKMRLNNTSKPLNIQPKKTENKKEIMSSGYSNFLASYYGIKPKNTEIKQNDYSTIQPVKADISANKIEVKQEMQNNLNYFNNSTLQYICDGLTENDISLYPFERIIVTITSWTKRIKNVHHVIQSILANTKQPDIININLAIEEFPNKEKDLPEELLQDLKNNSKIKITWLKHNTKVWKKLIPTLYKYPNDIIIPIDDDFTYPTNFIDTIYNEYLKYNKEFPISANRAYFFGMQCHCGCASLTKKEYIEPYFYILNDTIMTAGSDDIFYSFCAKKNNKEYKRSQIQFSINMPAYQANNAYSTGPGASCDITKTYRECEKSFNNIKKPLSKNDILNLLKNAKYKSLDIPKIASKQKIYLNTITENSKSFFDELRKNVFIYDLNSKLYNKEKAIISLTSWKERINYVGLTLYNLLSMCPDFHIVLVLSIDEFPKKEYELPENIKLLLHFKLIEILWVQKNYKAFKKVLFTMDKYREVPVISADDDCIYLRNYANMLYDNWNKNKNSIICNAIGNKFNFKHGNGPYTIYPPYCFKQYGISLLDEKILQTNNDDAYYGVLLTKLQIHIKELKERNLIIFHDAINPLGAKRTADVVKNDFKIINEQINTLNKIKLNLIGNSCVSAFITQNWLKTDFINPFCWNIIEYESMYNLIKYYDSINFLNYQIINDPKLDNIYDIIIDNKVTVRYIHYKQDNTANGIISKCSNIYSNNIKQYIIDKYESRIKKMLNSKIPPIFIIAAGYHQEYYYTNEQLQSIINLNSKYKIIISYDKCNVNISNNSNVIVLNHTFKMDIDGVHNNIAKLLYENIIKNNIDKFTKKYFSEILLLIKSTNINDFKDWLKWHLDTIHFDHIVVFDNDSPVDIKSICDKDDRIEYHVVHDFPNQYKIYNQYINHESKSEWVLPIDDDEYLYMKNFNNVNDMLIYYQNKWKDLNKLSIRWKNMFPENVNAVRENISLMDFCKNSNEKWAELFDGANKPVKTFVKTSQEYFYDISSRQTHIPISTKTKDKAYLCNGERMEGNWYTGPSTDDNLKILHYQFKSKDEWIWKCKNRRRVSMVDTVGYNSKRTEIYKKMI